MDPLYTISMARSAQKALSNLDRTVQKRIRDAIDNLSVNPRPASAIMLKGRHGSLRIRVGDYRVVYTIRDDVLVVAVVALGHRSDIYDGI